MTTQPVYRDSSQPLERRADDLLSRMSLEEKVAQLGAVYLGKSPRGDNATLSADDMAARFGHGIGQCCQVGKRRPPAEIADFSNSLQRYLVESTRLGIPAIMHEEGLHGMIAQGTTSLPVPVGLAATWDEVLLEDAFTQVAREMRACGIHLALSPVLDVAREARWGRFEETFGEDPLLVSRLGVAAVRGFQGRQPVGDDRVVATGKHFCGYSQSQNGNNVGPYEGDLLTLRRVHLEPFRRAIAEAGLLSIMPSYNTVFGSPNHGNRWLLTDVLRDEFGFEGIVVADYGGVIELDVLHGVVPDGEEAAMLALQSGVDVDLPNATYYKRLPELVRQGRIGEGVIDIAVRRVLLLKLRLGLFEHPYADPQIAVATCANETGQAIARRAAEESIILLRNDDALLPLDPTRIKSLAVLGPNAHPLLLGAYHATPVQGVSPLEGIQARLDPDVVVHHAPGCRITLPAEEAAGRDELNSEDPDKPRFQGVLSDADADADLIAEAVALAQKSDVAVLFLGGNMATSCESFRNRPKGDRAILDLLGGQRALFDAVRETGTPLVICLIHGGPVGDEHLYEHARTLIDAHYPGQATGDAVAGVLFGDVNPSGKLPYSVPRSAGHLPSHYSHTPAARRGYGFQDIRPAYSFGHGLSYTRFAYGEPRLRTEEIGRDDIFVVEVRVRNGGERDGTEVVQLYVRDVIASQARPVMELLDFARVPLAAGEERTVSFELPAERLAFTDSAGRRVLERGEFRLMLGGSSTDARARTVSLFVRDGE